MRDVSQISRKSAQVEEFAIVMKKLHQEVKHRLEKIFEEYKERADKTRRDLQFKEGDMVMVHLKAERLPKGKYTKLMMRKMGTFKVLKNCGTNSYKLELPANIGLSNILNVCDLYPYKGNADHDTSQMDGVEVPTKLPK